MLAHGVGPRRDLVPGLFVPRLQPFGVGPVVPARAAEAGDGHLDEQLLRQGETRGDVVGHVGHGGHPGFESRRRQALTDFGVEAEHELADGPPGAFVPDGALAVPDLFALIAAAPDHAVLRHDAEEVAPGGLGGPPLQAPGLRSFAGVIGDGVLNDHLADAARETELPRMALFGVAVPLTVFHQREVFGVGLREAADQVEAVEAVAEGIAAFRLPEFRQQVPAERLDVVFGVKGLIGPAVKRKTAEEHVGSFRHVDDGGEAEGASGGDDGAEGAGKEESRSGETFEKIVDPRQGGPWIEDVDAGLGGGLRVGVPARDEEHVSRPAQIKTLGRELVHVQPRLAGEFPVAQHHGETPRCGGGNDRGLLPHGLFEEGLKLFRRVGYHGLSVRLDDGDLRDLFRRPGNTDAPARGGCGQGAAQKEKCADDVFHENRSSLVFTLKIPFRRLVFFLPPVFRGG